MSALARLWLIGVAFLAAFAITAGAQPTAAPGPQAFELPLRIGASMSLSGPYQRIGREIHHGWELWVEQVSARGGILGRRVELVLYDDASDPEMAARLYESLITEDQVDLILGPYSTPLTLSASTVTEQYRYPMIAPGASGTDIWTRGYHYVFGIYTLAPYNMDGAIDIAVKNGYRTVAIVNENSAAQKEIGASAKRKAREMGLQVVFREEFESDVRDVSPVLTRVRPLNPDVLIGATYPDESTLIVRQLKDLDWAPKMVALTAGPGLPGFYDTLGPGAG